MAMSITLAPEAEQVKLGVGRSAATPSAVDLEPFKAPIANLANHMVGTGGYSKWVKVTFDKSDERKTAQRRFSSAAKLLAVHLGYQKDEKNDRALWFRLRPAPKARPGARKATATAGA